MSYDSVREKVVLFGGRGSVDQELGDTWEWDGVSWTDVSPASPSPSPRSGHSMVYDQGLGKTLLFGGRNGLNETDDSWEWDGSSWSNITTSDTPKTHASKMSYDGARKRDEFTERNDDDLGAEWDEVVRGLPRNRLPARCRH